MATTAAAGRTKRRGHRRAGSEVDEATRPLPGGQRGGAATAGRAVELRTRRLRDAREIS
jgi:hypothetical protein